MQIKAEPARLAWVAAGLREAMARVAVGMNI